MSRESREIVDNLEVGNNLEAEAHFTNAMGDKIGNSLESRRQELSNTFVNQKDTNEED